MPAYIRRELLTAAQRAELPALPTDRLEIRERYFYTPQRKMDIELVSSQDIPNIWWEDVFRNRVHRFAEAGPL